MHAVFEFVLDVFEGVRIGEEVEGGGGKGFGSEDEGFVTDAHAGMGDGAPGVEGVDSGAGGGAEFEGGGFPADIAYIAGGRPDYAFIPGFFDGVTERYFHELFPLWML